MARRFTSAKRTCSITCWLPGPPGSCSRLITFTFEALAWAISPALSITAVLETWPERISASSLSVAVMSSPGNSACSFCCSVLTPCSTTTSYCARRPAPQMMRLTVPAALPSIRTSRGCTTTASATAGFVTAMRVMSKSVARTVERPAVRTMRSKPDSAAGAWPAGDGAAAGACACAGPAARSSSDEQSANLGVT